MASRKYTSRFRNEPRKKEEEEEFTLNKHERPPMDLVRRTIILIPLFIALLVGAYFLHKFLTG